MDDTIKNAVLGNVNPELSLAMRAEPNLATTAEAMDLALRQAIARVEIAHHEGSDIMKALLPEMKDAVAAYQRVNAVATLAPHAGSLGQLVLVEISHDVRHLLGGLFKHPGHVMTSDADRTLAEGVLAKLDHLLKVPAEPEDGIEALTQALNAFETTLLHNKPMSANDLASRKALLADADDAVVRLEGALAAAQARAAFFERELVETRKDLQEWDGSQDALQTTMDNITLSLAGGSNGAFGSSSKVADPAESPVGKLLAHAAITHDTLSELAENGGLPSAIQARVADHLEEGTALFRAAGIESEPAPITADSLRM